jgi:hypothetical protein
MENQCYTEYAAYWAIEQTVIIFNIFVCMLYSKESGFNPTFVAFLVLIFVIVSITAAAQKRKLISGSLNGLKGQKSYDIKFTYDSMQVGDYVAENRYLAEKSMDWELKEPGKGPAFVVQWFDDRERLHEPAFIKGFATFNKAKLNDKKAKYTLILRTKHTEGGWSVGIASHPAEIDGELWIVESADQSHVIAKIGFSGVLGKVSYGGDFDMTWRIQSAYEFAGKLLGDFLKRKAK